MNKTKTIVESNNFIVLDQYTEIEKGRDYQSEADLERELIEDLQKQGYEYRTDLNNNEKLLANIRQQLQILNKMQFSDSEWGRFVVEYLDNPSENVINKSEKIHHNYIYDFVFDDGHIQNIYLWDRKNIANNRVQVINQFEQKGKFHNRYDVTILVNGLPLVQIELKRRGVAIREAFNQVHRYSQESFNTEHSLFRYLQIFVISNGTDTRYFANTTKRDKNSFDFTMNWAKSDNTLIKDLKDFTATFFQKKILLEILTKYCVFDVNKTLLIMRPYQIAATERMLWKMTSNNLNKQWSAVQSHGFIWHTTGSGKTLTSFKAAQLATELDFIDKVLFVVDRKDLDYQTMKEYQRFSPDSASGSNNTAALKVNIEKDDGKIIVTTIQKLNNLIKTETDLSIYNKKVVFIFDECHRSQFGEAQKNIRKKFKKYCQFGFTGTPIFEENAIGQDTTESVFGCCLHQYVITDAIRDEKVLKFKVDYNNVRPKFKEQESEQDEKKLSTLENRQALLHPERISEITQYILTHFKQKTHRLNYQAKGFNAMFAVSSIEAAKLYYEEFKKQQEKKDKPLKIATIFSFAPNEEQKVIGEIGDEGFEPKAMDESAKNFLDRAMEDYNAYFKTNYRLGDSLSFQNYYRDVSKRVKEQEIDLLIVVGMFLTGFDAPTLNTLFVDKNLRYHGLIQAYSRTNRIFDSTKSFGNIVTFRNLEQATKDAIALFAEGHHTSEVSRIVIERSYHEYIEGYEDEAGKYHEGYRKIVEKLQSQFAQINHLILEQDKLEFIKLFGKYLRLENILQNYDEFELLMKLHQLECENTHNIEKFKEKYALSQQSIEKMKDIPVLSERQQQDYLSSYHDIYESLKQKQNDEENSIDWNEVVFEVELLKTQEINLDYILKLILKYNKQAKNKDELEAEICRIIRSSYQNRGKERLIIDFINDNLTYLHVMNEEDIVDIFFKFAQEKKQTEMDNLISSEKLNSEKAEYYLNMALKSGYVKENGSDFVDILPKMSRLSEEYKRKRDEVLKKVKIFVDRFKGI